MTKIPTTDIRLYTQGSIKEQKEFIQIYGNSIQKFGFVIVEGHGVSKELIKKCYSLIYHLFYLPLETKMQYNDPRGHGQRGYIKFGAEHAKNNEHIDLKEFWHIGREHFKDQSYEKHYPKNVWPDKEIPEFKKNMLELFQSLDIFSVSLLCALGEYLNLPKFTLANKALDGNSILRALHYPPLTNQQQTGLSIRSAAHEDINLITILCEATESGLQLLTRSGKWIDIECGPGQMVVDSGDMLARLTNNLIPATTHRVINPHSSKNKARFSMPFFVHAYESCPLTVLKNCTSPSTPNKYPPLLAGEFLQQRLKEIGLGG